MNWRIKGLVQGALSALPAGASINDRLQRVWGGLRNFEQHIDHKVVSDWRVIAEHLRQLAVSPEDLDYVEVGTGWAPVLPVCFTLAGARSVTTYDVHRHLDSALTLRMVRRLEEHLPAIAEVSGRAFGRVRDLYDELRACRTVEPLLDRANVRYIAPGDASVTGLESASVNVVFSNSVLEHVPAETIAGIMQESRRILRPGGLAIHSINCGDHYAYFDRGITMINYLTYPESAWRKWNNPLLYQNRLRPADFLRSAESSGLEIVLRRSTPHPELLTALDSLKIAPEFEQYPIEQLASTSLDFVARNPFGSTGSVAVRIPDEHLGHYHNV